MVNFKVQGIWLFSILGMVLSHDEIEEHRHLTLKINPGCYSQLDQRCEWTNLSLIHIRSDSRIDSLHFIWSFHGAPSLLLARTSLLTNLTVSWEKFLDNKDSSISFDVEPYYTFGWSLYKVWMFTNEKNKDEVRLDEVNQTNVAGYDTRNFTWERQFDETDVKKEIKLTFISTNFNNHSIGEDKNSYFKFTVKVRNSDGYSDILPYMLHNGNISQVDIDFQKVMINYPNKNPERTRVGFALALASSKGNKSLDESIHLVKVKALDDEHTPGVFEMFSIRTPIQNLFDQAYLQWKPVCYIAKVRDISDSIDVIAYEISVQTNDNQSIAISNSVINAYFGEQLSNTVIQFANISFGTEMDGFYEKTSHISWTYLTGFGKPPKDYVSLLVKLVVAIGLGIPTLIIIASGIYICLKRVSKPKDDLLLGR